jgi:pimeloyl-ACP methyl ester carboxylesterase
VEDVPLPYFERAGARLYYHDAGAGPAIITTHGVTENHLYWVLPGVVDRLVAAGYRVISSDMRAHGLTRIAGPDKGYDVETVAGDLGALADHLGLGRFHLLTHATGGFAGLRYAMGHSDRLLSLMSTDTGAATAPSDAAADNTDPAVIYERRGSPLGAGLSRFFRGRAWPDIHAAVRANQREDVFLNSMHLATAPHAAFAWYEACTRLGDPDTLADFMDVFYDDPDPYISRLRQISCPCLALHGERDVLFVRPMAQLAREIPVCRLVVLAGRGHMTAFEDPARTSDELISFLKTCA